MPLFCIHAFDRPGADAIRAGNYAAHRAYLATAPAMGVTIHASGPLETDDGTRAIGSLLVVEAADEATARAFNAADPFALASLWAEVSIRRFDLRRGSVGTVSAPT
jgi:uncharacterized protein